MSCIRTCFLIMGFLCISVCLSSQVTIIPYQSSWNYSDISALPASQNGIAWYASSYNDSLWFSGIGQLGYGDGDENTMINSVNTAYFRKEFSLPDLCTYDELDLSVMFDDGVVIYINGQRAIIRRMRNRNSYKYSDFASSQSSDNEIASYSLPTSFFNAGTNVIAAEVHQRSSNSSDLSFDMQLLAVEDASLAGCVCNGSMLADADGDGVCDGADVCPNFDDNLIGAACDDNDPCTLGDVYTSACACVGTYTDSDGDMICDGEDDCPNLDNSLIGQSCDDSNNCTSDDKYTLAACGCAGTFDDVDMDGVCDADDVCPMFDDNLIGAACDDNNPCTLGDVYTSACECVGTYTDSDGDAICDGEDDCPNLDNALFGQPCDDGNVCTTGDTYDSNSCSCVGTFQDADADTVCDAQDQCPSLDDRLLNTSCNDNNVCTTNDIYIVNGNNTCECVGTFQDTDSDGICDAQDACPSLPNSLIGTNCDDGNACTINDVYGTDCNCNGTFQDTDMDSVCDAEDQCPGEDDGLIGTPCDDGDICTINDKFNTACDCAGTYVDSDNDSVCDGEDICPNFDDRLIGTACDDDNICTDNDLWNSACNCVGTFNDADSDGVCDKLDLCAGDDALCPGYQVNDFTNCVNKSVSGVPNDLSGVSYNEDSGTLFGVRNGTPEIYEMDLDGNVIRKITLNNFEDTEGIVYLGNNKYAVAEERRRRIVVVTIPNGNSNITIQYPGSLSRIQLTGTGTGNIGLEGLAYDKVNDILYAGKEINNMAIYTLENPLSKLGTSFSPLQLFNLQNLSSNYPPSGGTGFSDLAGLSFTDRGTFLALSHEAEHIVEIHPYTGAVVSNIDITGFNMSQPEGVTYISPNEIIIVGEPNQFVFARRIGSVCDDGDDCTINDAYDANCNCVGVFEDTDNDSVCDDEDICPGFNDKSIGLSCDDGIACTINDVYTTNCICEGTFQDSDGDSVCDVNDACPTDPNKSNSAGLCGCGNVDVDRNNDGICDTDCIDTLDINSVLNSDSVYEARLSITSDALLDNGKTYDYSAGQIVNLEPGFKVDSGTTFHAYILGCEN